MSPDEADPVLLDVGFPRVSGDEPGHKGDFAKINSVFPA